MRLTAPRVRDVGPQDVAKNTLINSKNALRAKRGIRFHIGFSS
jgi:hypothetical protein